MTFDGGNKNLVGGGGVSKFLAGGRDSPPPLGKNLNCYVIYDTWC